jgi:transcription initiation factor TFIIA large subunit
LFCLFVFILSEAAAAAQTPATTPNAATGAATTAAAAAPATTTVRTVPVQITVPPQAGVAGHTAAKSITVHVPAHALQGYFPFESRSYYLQSNFFTICNNVTGGAAGAQLQTILSSPAVTAALSLPVEMATTVLQQHINNALQVPLVEIESTRKCL